MAALTSNVERQRQRLELAKIRAEIASLATPWWRSPSVVTTLTALIAAVLPVTTWVSGLIDKAKADAAEERKWSEAVRTGYLDRIQPKKESNEELKDRALADQRHISEWQGDLVVLRFVSQTSHDGDLKNWATDEMKRIEGAIKETQDAMDAEAKAHATEQKAVAVLDQVASKKGPDGAAKNSTPEEAQARAQALAAVKKVQGEAAQQYRAAAKARANVALPIGASTSSPSASVHPQILWVDDNPGNNREIADVLQASGATIFVSTTNADAERKLQDGTVPYDLVISDMGRSQEHTQRAALDLLDWMGTRKLHIPLVVYSSHGGAADTVREANERHAVGSTDRPSELLRFIQQAVPGWRLAGASPQ